MSGQFVSHVDWNIKTPFVSYSDPKFLIAVGYACKQNAFTKNAEIIDMPQNGFSICRTLHWFIRVIRKKLSYRSVDKIHLLDKTHHIISV